MNVPHVLEPQKRTLTRNRNRNSNKNNKNINSRKITHIGIAFERGLGWGGVQCLFGGQWPTIWRGWGDDTIHCPPRGVGESENWREREAAELESQAIGFFQNGSETHISSKVYTENNYFSKLFLIYRKYKKTKLGLIFT